MNQILVTGGLGYIGSHTVIELLAAGYEPIVIDNLSESPIEVKDRIEKTMKWLFKEMLTGTSDGVGGDNTAFAASLDADSEGEEGKYYVWTTA